ncbi:FkbM family methyltransferase [Acidianus manzaensis]|uniref:Methyltransferase FkbM domain-containing protein n=1 Tax=Acidianus manzaensis TaxID=282676 RepID=A0A1W6JWL2_9CREN|nr:FkbM family methyltransferase [Acidianus manzaensis]ARM74637.1 hypothetical protein B6F84_00420 [Acidianus manzaensis]
MKSKITNLLGVRPLSFRDLYLMANFVLDHKNIKAMENDHRLVKIKYNNIIWNLRYSMLDFDLGIIMGTHELEIIKWVDFRTLRTFVDVGAYIGTYTLRAAYYGANVYAFEPNPYSYSILERNIADNNFNNVKLYNVALYDQPAEMDICIGDVGSSLIRECNNQFKVKTLTLDSINFDEKIDLIKIDAEGAEYPILKGGLKTLDITQKILIEITKDEQDIHNLLVSRGFKIAKKGKTNETTQYILYER